MPTLERAIEIAASAHLGQLDKAGEPYIAHPLRVMLPFIRGGDETRAIIAVLHDVIEDSSWTAADLHREGFRTEIVEAVTALTRPPEEAYSAFVRRAVSNELARPVKAADLRDNLQVAHSAKLPEEERERLLEKYTAALRVAEQS